MYLINNLVIYTQLIDDCKKSGLVRYKIKNILANGWVKIGLTVLAPVLILTRLSGANGLGVAPAFLLALALPLIYGCYELYQEKRVSFIIVVGLTSVLLTGGIGLMRLDSKWLAIKEAAVPFVIGAAVLISRNTRYAIVPTFIDQVINLEKVNRAWLSNTREQSMEKVMKLVTVLVASSFMLSASLNWGLAKYIVRSQAGTEAFNHELARLTLVSYPVIVIPSMAVLVAAIIYFINQVEKQTGLQLEDILKKR